MSTTTRRHDVAPVDAPEMVWILATIGVCLVVFGMLTAWTQRGVLFGYWPGTPTLFTVGGVALVGALVVKVLGDRPVR